MHTNTHSDRTAKFLADIYESRPHGSFTMYSLVCSEGDDYPRNRASIGVYSPQQALQISAAGLQMFDHMLQGVYKTCGCVAPGVYDEQ